MEDDRRFVWNENWKMCLESRRGEMWNAVKSTNNREKNMANLEKWRQSWNADKENDYFPLGISGSYPQPKLRIR